MGSGYCQDCGHHINNHRPSVSQINAKRECLQCKTNGIPYKCQGYRDPGQHSYGCELGHGGKCNCGYTAETAGKCGRTDPHGAHGIGRNTRDWCAGNKNVVAGKDVEVPEKLPDDIRDLKLSQRGFTATLRKAGSPYCIDCGHHERQHEGDHCLRCVKDSPVAESKCNGFRDRPEWRPCANCDHSPQEHKGTHCLTCDNEGGAVCTGYRAGHHDHYHNEGDTHGSINPSIPHTHAFTGHGVGDRLPDDIRDMKIDKSQAIEPRREWREHSVRSYHDSLQSAVEEKHRIDGYRDPARPGLRWTARIGREGKYHVLHHYVSGGEHCMRCGTPYDQHEDGVAKPVVKHTHNFVWPETGREGPTPPNYSGKHIARKQRVHASLERLAAPGSGATEHEAATARRMMERFKSFAKSEAANDIKGWVREFWTKYKTRLDPTFTPAQAAQIDKALGLLPLKFVVKQIDDIHHHDLGSRHGKWIPEEQRMVLADKAFEGYVDSPWGGKPIRRILYTVVHEAMHDYDEEHGRPSLSKEWLELSGWTKKEPPDPDNYLQWVDSETNEKSKWWHRRGSYFTRYYARRNPKEDFADCARRVLLSKDTSEPKLKFVKRALDL